MNNRLTQEISMANVEEPCGPRAEQFTLDVPRIPSVELPLIVRNQKSSVKKAIDMCGGLHKIRTALNETGMLESQNGLELYLNNDKSQFFNEHSITGKKVPFRDDSVLLKVKLPQGTMERNGGDLRKALDSLNEDQYNFVPVGIIDRTIKFREMSDFQYRLDNVPAAKEFQSSFLTLDWENIKKYVNSVPDDDTRPQENIGKLINDTTLNCPNFDFQLPPPPRFSTIKLPHMYKYKTNPMATLQSNGITEVKGSYIKNYQLLLHGIDKNYIVPTDPHKQLQLDYETACKDEVYPGTKKESKFYEHLQECLKILNELFQKRPIWVKRHLDGIVPAEIHHTIKIALALVSYRFSTGPWRNTYIKFGVDPRASTEYAKYQTEYFKIERRLLLDEKVKKNVSSIPNLVFESNIKDDIDTRFKFDGTAVPWYLMLQIDLLIHEPNIKEVYDKVEYLEEPNELTGWFDELDLIKIRKIVKYELGCLAQGNSEFSPYKLKYFRTMELPKETENEQTNNDGEDDTGDVDMDANDSSKEAGKNLQRKHDNVANDNDHADDEDNGIETGEIDEQVLEIEEEDTGNDIIIENNDIQPSQVQDSWGTDDDKRSDYKELFDRSYYENTDFEDIIKRIAELNPEEAKILNDELEGFVHESKL